MGIVALLRMKTGISGSFTKNQLARRLKRFSPLALSWRGGGSCHHWCTAKAMPSPAINIVIKTIMRPKRACGHDWPIGGHPGRRKGHAVPAPALQDGRHDRRTMGAIVPAKPASTRRPSPTFQCCVSLPASGPGWSAPDFSSTSGVRPNALIRSINACFISLDCAREGICVLPNPGRSEQGHCHDGRRLRDPWGLGRRRRASTRCPRSRARRRR
jgi:hypothetical protein